MSDGPDEMPETTERQCPVCRGSHVMQEANVLLEGGRKKIAYRCVNRTTRHPAYLRTSFSSSVSGTLSMTT